MFSRHHIYSAILLSCLFFFISCEKEITLDLPGADPKIVLEGNVYLNQFPVVKVSKTMDFYDASSPNPFSGAEVVITVGSQQYKLEETAPGNYTTQAFKGEVNTLYQVSVVAEGLSYTAQSMLYPPKKVNSTKIEKAPEIAGRKGYRVTLEFDDDEENEFYFRAKAFENKKAKEDRVSKTGNIRLRTRFENSSTVTALLYTIDKESFTFFKVFTDLANDGGSSFGTQPSNPQSNWNNEALGHFTAASIDTVQVVIPE